MKISTVLALLVSGFTAFGQGRMQLANNSLWLVYFTTDAAHLYAADADLAGDAVTSVATPSGVTFLADLYAGTSSSSLTLVSTTTMSPIAAGRFNSLNVTLPGIPADETAWFEIRIRDSSFAPGLVQVSGSYFGSSGIFSAVPQNVVFHPIFQPTFPVFSTWAPGICQHRSGCLEPGVRSWLD